MKLLIITHTTPNLPNKDGFTLILYYLLQHLNKEFTVTVLARDQHENNFAQTILEQSSDYDVVYLHGTEVLDLLPHLNTIPRLIAGIIDVPSYKYAQLAQHETSALLRRKWLKQQHTWEAFEHTYLSRAHTIIVGSEADKTALLKLVSGQPFIQVIANGVDSDYFTPRTDVTPEHAIIFSGVLDQPSHTQAILQFYKAVWPLLIKTDEQLQWYIVGKDPDKKITQLESKDTRIHVTGFVPEVREFLVRAEVFISPLHIRSGIRNTVLEAMACALPVVAYADACVGLEVSPIRKVSTPHDFAETVQALLHNPDSRSDVGTAARKYVLQHHAWAHQTKLYEDTFKHATR